MTVALNRILMPLMVASTLGGCTLAGTSRPSGPTPSFPEPSSIPAASSEREPSATSEGAATSTAVVEVAFQAIGTPYEWGGTSANGFDCSGLIRYAYGRFGIDLPRISRDQLHMGSPVDLRLSALHPGDILGFSAVPGGVATHVGLYVGDGRFIHSSTSGVRVSDLSEPYWQSHLMAARRILE